MPTRQRGTWLLRGGQKAVNMEDLPDSAWVWHTPHEGDDSAKDYIRKVPWLARAVQMRAQAVASLPFALVDLAAKAAKEEQDAERAKARAIEKAKEKAKPKPKPVPFPPEAAPGAEPEEEPEEESPEVEEPEEEIVVDYDTSANWENKIGFLPDPQALLWLIEAALCVYGYAYVLRDRTTRRTAGLRYLVPTTIKPVIKPESGLVNFERTIGAGTIELAIEDLLYFWSPDPYTEIGPPGGSPCIAALSAAGVLFNVDKFATEFFKSGAIKATLLKVPGVASTDERNRLKAWWKRIFSGIEKAYTTEIVSSDVETEQIGEGISELTDTELVQNKREDISTAMGIPHSLLFSNASTFATAQQDDLHFYSKTIVPEAEFIAGVFNSQLLAPLGLRWEFRPETLDAYQEDEAQRAQALQAYTSAGMKLSIAAQILGIELPEGVEYEDLDPEEKEPVLGAPGQLPVPGVTPPALAPFAQATEQATQPQKSAQQEAMLTDLRRWRDKARKNGGSVPFESEFIPAEFKAGLEAAIALEGPDDAFAFLKKKTGPGWEEPPDIARLRRRVQQNIQPILDKYAKKVSAAIRAGTATETILEEMFNELRAALAPELALITTRQLGLLAMTVGVHFDVAAISTEALAWADRYSFQLVRGITDTTRKLLQQATSTFISAPGMTREQLEALIAPAFGPVRAEMIATTEVTRAYSEATNEQQKWLEGAGVRMRRIWQTLQDELVCPICGPLNEQPEDVWRGEFPDGPPAHVNCRCNSSLEVA